jgi:hypothetical protein
MSVILFLYLTGDCGYQLYHVHQVGQQEWGAALEETTEQMSQTERTSVEGQERELDRAWERKLVLAWEPWEPVWELALPGTWWLQGCEMMWGSTHVDK